MIEQPVLEHGMSRTGRWLRRNRTTIALAIAIVEAILLIAGAINRPLAIVFAVGVIVIYLWFGRRLRPSVPHDIAWIAAVSQALVALIPLLLFVLTTVAVVGVAILAVVALIVLFSRR
jgi:hypothetical protein